MSKGHQSGLKLSQLRALVAVADCGNFGEAAWQLGLTQPTVSHAIATLENELGVVLLSRGRHGAQLTPAGEAVTQHARDVLHLLGTMQQAANLHKGLQGGQVRVATFRSAAANLLPKIVAQFQIDYPAVDVAIKEFYDYTYVERQVRDGKADIGITFLPTSHEFETWEMMRDPYWVLLPPNTEVENTRLTWEQLIALPLILYPEDNSCFANVKEYFQQAGYSLEPRYQFRETHTILNMVAQGLGAAIIPSLSSNPIPTGVKVVRLPSTLERTVGMVLLADALQTPAVFAFLNVLKQQTFLPEESIIAQ
ncbi:MAG: LysR family transcriptional regulator [Leptolyngbya sp. SIO1D8]|nr:LysR family transcriptional regulator [Leptolyngbya sp. SIO1D8]